MSALLFALAPSPSPGPGDGGGVGMNPLNFSSMAGLLAISMTALIAVFYSILRGKLRPESAVLEARQDRDARVAEARQDRDDRLREAQEQIVNLRQAHQTSEEARRSQEALLRESTMEIARTVQHVLNAFNEARSMAQRDDQQQSS